jgi:hypothetical protein
VVGVALAIGGVLLGLYSLPPESPIAYFVLVMGTAFTFGGVWLMMESRRRRRS